MYRTGLLVLILHVAQLGGDTGEFFFLHIAAPHLIVVNKFFRLVLPLQKHRCRQRCSCERLLVYTPQVLVEEAVSRN